MSETPALRLELNHLLKDIPSNGEKIHLAMRELALCKIKRIHFRNWQDREDVASEAVMYVMGRLHKYNPGRHAACAFFGLMLRRKMLRLLREMKNDEVIHDSRADGDTGARQYKDCSILDSAPARRMPRATVPRWRDAQVRDPQDRDRVRNVLDEALENACRFADASAEDPEVERAQLAVGVLQHVRKALLGRFNRIEADYRRAGG